MVYSFFDNVTAVNYRMIQTSLAKIKIPVLEYAIELVEGDGIAGNTGDSSYEFFIESPIFAVQSGGYHNPIRRYTPNNFWYVDTSIFVTIESDTDAEVRYTLHSNYRNITTFIKWETTTENLVQTCPVLYLLHTGNNYLVGFANFYDQTNRIIVTDPTTYRIGYMSYAGPLRGGYSFFSGAFSAQQTDFDFGNYIYNASEPISTDPYTPEGESEGHVGGDGTHEEDSDSIPIPPEPTLSAANTNFIRLYNPTLQQLQSLANYMWSDLFDLNTFKKIFSDPISCILGLSIVPVAIRNGGTSSVVLGNVDTEVQMIRAYSQYETVECGSLTVSEYWGAYLDYSPYTKFELYLPYIGIRPISADDIMGKTIGITYRVDILSGSCIAYVKCDDSVLYSFIGQCSSSIPITGNDWTNVINGAINIAGAVGTLVATGGFSAPAQIAATAAGTAYQAKHLMNTGASLAQNIMSMKPQIEKSGSLSGTGGMLGIQKPYLIITRPKQALPARQNYYMGYPSFVTVQLGDVSGYTEIDSIHLENIPATSDELNEIERLLKGGVIL